MSRTKLLSVISGILAVHAFGGTAVAADLVAPEPAIVEPAPVDSPWSGHLAIYGWLPWMSGDTGFDGLPPASFSMSPTDIINVLDFTIQATGEINYNRVGIFGDLIYLKISDGAATSGPVFDSAGLGLGMTIGTLAGTYTFYEDDSTAVKVMAGARLWSIDMTLNLFGGPGGTVSANQTIQWVDPVVGLRGRKQLNEKVYVTATGLVGGFGAGSSFMWDAFAGIGYEFNDHLAITAGYRGLGTDYSDSGDVVDIISHGPLLGFGFQF